MDDRPIYPLTFQPVFKDYPWGGRNLERILGRKLPPGIVAESWEISGHPHGPTPVKNGPLAGLTLPQVQEKLGLDLVGRRSRQALELGKFPLLIKLLDANQWLSVQVHPDDRYALEHEGELGKTEMWVVLHARPGAELIYGLKAGVTPEAFRRAVAEDRVAELLHRVQVRPGDVIFVPPGTVHSLGPGIIVAEIQQNSDVTYRIYDWGRVGPDGKPRPLHIEKALEVINWEMVEPGPVIPQPLERDGIQRELLVHCPYFRTERLEMAPGASFPGQCDGETFEIWAVLKGRAAVHWQGEPLELTGVGWTLLPAALGDFHVQAEEASELLRVFVPEGKESKD